MTHSSSLVDAFRYALRGLVWAVVSERSVRLELLVLAVVIALGLALQLSASGWALVAAAAVAVLVTELINSSIEALADAVHPQHHDGIARAKDIAAGAVLLVSLAAVVVGLAVLGPPLLNLVY